MRKITLFVLTLALALGNFTSAPVQAQVGNVQVGYDVGAYVSGVTTSGSVPVLIRYIGNSPQGGTVTVSSIGDITLKTGAVGGSTADLTTECPVSGALGGIIDVSDAACNTLGEVVDAINASPNWRAVIQDGLRSDSADDDLYDLSETAAAAPEGLPLYQDGAALDRQTIALVPVRNDIRWYLNEGAVSTAGVQPNNRAGVSKNPFNDSATGFLWTYAVVTGTGAQTAGFNVYSVLGNYNRPTLAAASTAASILSTSTETVTTLLTDAPGANNTAKTWDFSRYGIGFRRGEKLLVRISDAALTDSKFNAVGRFTKRNQ